MKFIPSKKNTVLVFILMLAGCFLQAQDLNQRLTDAMKQKESNSYYGGTRAFTADAKNTSENFLQLVEPYLSSPNENIRSFSCDLLMLVVRQSKAEQSRTKACNLIANALSDSIYQVRRNAAQLLTEVPLRDFSEEAKQAVSNSLSMDIKQLTNEQLLLCGYLQLQDDMPRLRELVDNREVQRTLRWSANKALARMGDEDALAFILRQVERAGLNDDVVYELLPDLIYTKQRQAFDYLIQALNSDIPNCMSSNPDNETQILCGYRIMELLAPEIKKFPLDLEASGDIKTKDYEKALQTVREWFRKHPDYVILGERF